MGGGLKSEKKAEHKIGGIQKTEKNKIYFILQ
jgi:hypothetical protein